MTQSLSPARAQSFGKLILIGEHAVVYGAPAIAVGISLGARAEAELSSGSSWLQLGEQRVQVGEASDTARAFAALLSELRDGQQRSGAVPSASRALPQVGVRAALDLPAGVGLGASAAIAVAIAKACVALSGQDQAAALPLVLRAAGAWESVFHGTPSGVDVAAALAGAPIWFVRGEPAQPLACRVPLELAVGLAGPPASTSLMVRGVHALRLAQPERVDALISDISALARSARSALSTGDLPALGQAMNHNHHALQALGVSTDSLNQACRVALSSGALGAKLTGAGGGGAVVALCAGSPDAVLASWQTAGIQGFATRVAAQGTSAPPPQPSTGGAQHEDT